MQLDLYEILSISIDASENEIKKAFRKSARECHPDKNPDNPAAGAEFDRLKKILEVLIDPGSRAAYDRVLKGRRLAAVRARETSAKTQKLKSDLERREREVALAKDKLSDAERFRRELKRLEEEGAQIIAEEVARAEKEAKEERKKVASRLSQPAPSPAAATKEGSYKVKVRWTTAEETEPYTKDQIHTLFYKWGDINAVVIKQKGQKGTALVDYKLKSGAEMATQFERGLPECPVSVTEVCPRPPAPSTTPSSGQDDGEAYRSGLYGAPTNKRDYETLADMEKRRRNERARLIEEMKREGVEGQD